MAQFEQEFNENLQLSKGVEIKKLSNLGMVEVVDGYLRIADNHFFVSNSIILELI